jgi:predicted RecB family nuclease
MRITRSIFTSYLHCKYKAYLELQGAVCSPTQYMLLSSSLENEFKATAKAAILTDTVSSSFSPKRQVTVADLQSGPSLIFDASIKQEHYSFDFDAIQRTDGKSGLGKFAYIPFLFTRDKSVHAHHRLVLTFGASVIGSLQGLVPSVGIIVHGKECNRVTVKLEAYHRKVSRIMDGLQEIVAGTSTPRLILNDHCRQCPFMRQCREKAVVEDDLSLLDRMNEKTIARYHRKGIFTVNQLSYTFRPRKRNKRVKTAKHPFDLALQALAIREKTVYVFSRPHLPESRARVYVDMEGDPTGAFVYLIGLIVISVDQERSYSFWADTKADEEGIFRSFLDLIKGLGIPHIYHYGSYESRVFKRMLPLAGTEDVVHILTEGACNIVAAIHSNVYFPGYSNSLKDIGGYLGCRWSLAEVSGLHTLVWRADWERTKDRKVKAMLLQYNREDCLALKRVTDFLYEIQNRDTKDSSPGDHTAVTFVESVKPGEYRGSWGNMEPAIEEFGQVIRCAYFDYQTSKVYIRTNPGVMAANRRRQKRKGGKLRVNDVIDHPPHRCSHCGSSQIGQREGRRLTKTTIDLKFCRVGIKRYVTLHHSRRHTCQQCGQWFVPKEFTDQPHFGAGLTAWAMYQYVANRMSFKQIKLTAQECFDVPLPVSRCHLFKQQLARKYKDTVDRLLGKILGGYVVHMDETKIRLKKESGYVFVITNMEEVEYLYRPTRETDFLDELLEDFGGVLVTDFYSGYDSARCLQQKCLVHLIRDLNDDVLKNPFDQELIAIAQAFGSLMRRIVDTIDHYGLKARYLGKHRPEVQGWLSKLDSQVCVSDIAEGYRKRMVKYREKLFVFLDHDGVPWNNNNAEHAVKPFARFRRLVNGQITEQGVTDYLVLLSLQQTCDYRGIRFLDFLLSGELDLDLYCLLHKRGG